MNGIGLEMVVELPAAVRGALAVGAALAVVACGPERRAPQGRMVLQSAAMRELDLSRRDLAEADSLTVPAAIRREADGLRTQLNGTAEAVRYYPVDNGSFVALVPSRSFEGEDPHVVAVFEAAGTLRVARQAFEVVERYCPPSGRLHPDASARDSADGCRHFDPPRVAGENRTPARD